MIDRLIATEDAVLCSEAEELNQAFTLEFQNQREKHYRNLVQKLLTLSAEIPASVSEQIQDHIHEYSVQITSNITQTIRLLSLQVAHGAHKNQQLQAGLQLQREKAQSLLETVELQQRQINSWQQEYESLKTEALESQEKYERRLREAKREKKEIKQTFRLVQQHTEIQRALLENLQLEKEEISEQATSQKREKQALLDQLQEIQQKFIESEKQLSASASKLTWEEKRISKLEEESAEKDRLIGQLMKEIKQSQREQQPSLGETFSVENVMRSFREESHPAEEPKKYVSFIQSFKLSDEVLNIHEDYELVSRKSSSRKSMGQEEDLEINKSFHEPTKEFLAPVSQQPLSPSRIVFPDFYLAHFLLTSQAIKIKTNCEQYLGVDLSNQYPEVIKERVPFHLWDEWIRAKLQQLAS